CAGGRDRTGIAAAFVLSVLGVADDVIAADYARTGAHLRRHAHRFRRVREKMGFTDHDVAEMLETEADDMLRFLGWLRAEHGGTEAFLRKAGVPDRTLDTLRADLIVPR
ncbi:MAG: tyrosine-protein phosphatase, partial [Gammaproteobacteria bacterium]